MYSIRERKNKDGSISFSIQVKIIGFDGNEIQKAITWKPTNKLTEKQLKLAVNRVAKEYEAKVIDELGLMILQKDIELEMKQEEIDKLRRKIEVIEQYISMYEENCNYEFAVKN